MFDKVLDPVCFLLMHSTRALHSFTGDFVESTVLSCLVCVQSLTHAEQYSLSSVSRKEH